MAAITMPLQVRGVTHLGWSLCVTTLFHFELQLFTEARQLHSWKPRKEQVPGSECSAL